MSQTSKIEHQRDFGGRIDSCGPVVVSDRVWAALLSLKAGIGAESEPSWSKAELAAWKLYSPLAALDGNRLVFAQIAQSIDGRIANPAGETQEISGSSGIEHLHRCRALADVVLVGAGTVLADEPRLTVRLVEGENPVRAAIDTHRRIVKDAPFCRRPGQFILIRKDDGHGQPSISEIVLSTRDDGRVAPSAIIEALAQRGLRRILVEGGPATIAGFIDAGALDRLHVSISPLIIGSGRAGLEPAPVARLADALRPTMRVYALDTDLVLDCNFQSPGSRT